VALITTEIRTAYHFPRFYQIALREIGEDQGTNAVAAFRQAFQDALRALRDKGWSNSPPFRPYGISGRTFACPLYPGYILTLDVDTHFADEKPVHRILWLVTVERPRS